MKEPGTPPAGLFLYHPGMSETILPAPEPSPLAADLERVAADLYAWTYRRVFQEVEETGKTPEHVTHQANDAAQAAVSAFRTAFPSHGVHVVP